MTQGRILADFEGNWRLSREITESSGARARFEGSALWCIDGSTAQYREEGHLILPGQTPMHAERKYTWHEDLSVYFDDGRFFHVIPPMGGDTDHWCDPDSYKGRYDFARWPEFTVRWEVRGPRKAYVSDTLYSRV